MNGTEKQILKLISEDGKSAATMNNALKIIGNGNMEDGIKRIAEHFLGKGQKSGVMCGSVATLTFGAIIFVAYKLVGGVIRKNKSLEVEGKEILSILETEMSDEKVLMDEDFKNNFKEKTEV